MKKPLELVGLIALFYLAIFRPTPCSGATTLTSIPIVFDLPKAGYVTLVADDDDGHRVANILAQTYMPAGPHRINWDGFDVGQPGDAGGQSGQPPTIRHRIASGTYHLHGLYHDGLHLLYEFPVYNSGNPPWINPAGTGAWFTDHSTPSDILLLPPGASTYGDEKAPQFLMSAQVAEEGCALLWTDLEGHKLAGSKLGGWNGGYALAADGGPNADTAAEAYTLIVAGSDLPDNVHGGYEVWRLGKNGSSLKVFSYSLTDHFVTMEGFPRGPGFAVRDQIAVISDFANDVLVVVDLDKRSLIGTIPLKDAHGLAFGENGNLFVLTEHHLKEFHFDAAGLKLTDEHDWVSSGLEDPQRLLVTADKMYVSDWGTSHQVKVFDRKGRPMLVMGKKGGPQKGPYDPEKMQFPLGLALDPKGQLWVMEHDWLPKRVSVWSDAGKFVKGFYGPPQYGGGGMIDPSDKNKFYLASNAWMQGGMQFNLDWKEGTSQLADIFLRGPIPLPDLLRGQQTFYGNGFNHADYFKNWDRSFYPYDLPRTAPPERAIHLNDKVYLTNAFNGWERGNFSNGIFQMKPDGTVIPVASAGPLATLLERWALAERHLHNFEAIKEATKEMDINSTAYVWSDQNGDGIMDPKEMQFRTMPADAKGHKPTDTYGGMYVDDQLVITTAFGLQLKPTRFDENGIPRYDLGAAPQLARLDDGQPVPGKDGWLVNASGPYFKGYKDGQEMWRMATYGYNYVPQSPSEIVNPTRIIGPVVSPRQGDAGELFAINGEKGSLYLITLDGLFVANLAGDTRTTPLVRFPEAKRGMDIAGYSLEDENFHPTMEQLTGDGEIYVIAGKEYTGVYHLTGLETVRRFSLGDLRVTDDQIAAIPETQTTAHERRDAVTLTIPRLEQPPEVGGAGDEAVTIDPRASASLALSGDHLYATYHTGDRRLLENAGGSDSVIFKTGGGLDLMLRETALGPQPGNALAQGVQPIQGDLRLFVTRVAGKTKAVLFRAVVPQTAEADRTVLSSPIGNVSFDSITDVSTQVELKDDGKGNYQFAVPLAVLGWSPTGGSYHGDLGVLRGNGQQTLQRSYWSNTNATIVSDVPSEARLEPLNWGEFCVP